MKADRSTETTGPDEARRTTRGHEARHRGTPLATTKADGQVPSSDGRQVPQTRRARTARNEPRHRNRCQATPAAVLTDVCAPGSEPPPAGYGTAAVRTDECAPRGYPAPAGHEQPPSGWTSVGPVANPAPAGYKYPPSGWASVRPTATHRTPNPQHNTPRELTGEKEPRGPRHRTPNRAHQRSTPVNKSQGAQDTVHATQHTERAHR